MAEPLDPQKYHIISQQTKKILILAGIAFAFTILPAILYFYYSLAINRPSPLDTETTFEIKSGQGIEEIAKNLYQQKLVNSEFLFSIYVFLNKLDTNIQAGVYTIKAGTPVTQLVTQFQHGIDDEKITFIEGWRVEEYARAAAKQFSKIDYAEFVKQAKPYEGYLFPDTYYFEKEIREDDLISQLKDNFDQKTKTILAPESIKTTGLTKEQIVTLASIVEREVNNDTDRPIVAGILYNRFKQGMRIDADATTQYAVALLNLCGKNITEICATPLEKIERFNWWESTLTIDNLNYDNPYNTRKVTGLPPAPISNPGLVSIQAVVNRKDTEFLYYLTDTLGNTHYAKTLDEHNANIAKFLQ